jgi:hypothetical protein
MQARIEALSQFGANPEGGVSRIAFSDADVAGRAWLIDAMRNVGLDVRVDTAGNIIGRRAGRDDDLPPILFGSHIDSVPGGGNYDGDVGVIGAIEVIELLNEHDIETHHPLEVVSFTDEEGGLVGSRAMVGTCMTMGTASTMTAITEAMGLTLSNASDCLLLLAASTSSTGSGNGASWPVGPRRRDPSSATFEGFGLAVPRKRAANAS